MSSTGATGHKDRYHVSSTRATNFKDRYLVSSTGITGLKDRYPVSSTWITGLKDRYHVSSTKAFSSVFKKGGVENEFGGYGQVWSSACGVVEMES